MDQVNFLCILQTLRKINMYILGMEKSDESRTRRDEQRRKYSKMDKWARDKLVRSPTENGGG